MDAIVNMKDDANISYEVEEKIKENVVKNTDTLTLEIKHQTSGITWRPILKDYPCQICGKILRSRNSLNSHKTVYHPG